MAVSATLTEINASLAVLLKNFQQYFDTKVARRFNMALTTGLENLCHIAATSTSTVIRNRIFRTKEVILLPGVAEN